MTARLLALMLLAAALPALAVEPDEILDDPGLEARARVLSKDIRCLVCQNESIDSSNAEMAKDLRVLVRERLVAGDSDEEVFDYLVARYGDYVLLEPPMRPRTYLLWFGPALLLLLGGLGVALFFRGRRKAAAQPAPLTAAERRRLEALLEESGDQRR
ncbi:MAG: cytochrome c-type biogenesis protein CcmH [Kiloniellales bacterium]|nr:cytochrome c-type biogenesis protein CcmH [Kiloniellales bacterium]